MDQEIQININGSPVNLRCDNRETLLYVLRERLALTGTKDACSSGGCGSCSIILDGQLVCACLVLAVEAHHAHVETIEGISRGEHLHPLQQALAQYGATQCGICMPGIVTAAKALLDRNAAPSEAQVREALAGNLCRCTGYDTIVRAVMDASSQL